MAKDATPHFHNDCGHETIKIGVKEFQCIGALPPLDHPHIFIDMGAELETVCPYCSTRYQYDGNINAQTTIPDGCRL